MITIYAMTRPFEPPFDVIQDNAVYSWKALWDHAQVLLYPDVELKQVNKVMQSAHERAVHDIRLFCNSDNLFF